MQNFVFLYFVFLYTKILYLYEYTNLPMVGSKESVRLYSYKRDLYIKILYFCIFIYQNFVFVRVYKPSHGWFKGECEIVLVQKRFVYQNFVFLYFYIPKFCICTSIQTFPWLVQRRV